METDRMLGIDPESWLPHFDMTSGIGVTEQQSEAATAAVAVNLEDFANLQSPCFSTTLGFDFNTTDDMFGATREDTMDCNEMRTDSLTNMEEQYITHERTNNQERASLQMVMEILNKDTASQQQQQHQLQQHVMQLRQQQEALQLQEQQLQQQLFVQQLQQQLLQQQGETEMSVTSSSGLNSPDMLANGSISSRISDAYASPPNIHGAQQAPHPDDTTPSSPDSTTRTRTSKRRSCSKTTKKSTDQPSSKTTSCSVHPSEGLAPLPQSHEMRIRVNYRTIPAVDRIVSSPAGCLIFFNRPSEKRDLNGVELVTLPPLFQTTNGVTEKQWKYTSQVLNVIEKGIRFWTDHSGNIFALRHCQSKVFWWNTMSQSNTSTEIKRNDPIMVFNNVEFENQLREYAGMSSIQCLKPGVVLTFAQRWSKFDSHLNAHLVYAVITPLKAVKLLEYLMEPKGEMLKSLDHSLNTGHLLFSAESRHSMAS